MQRSTPNKKIIEFIVERKKCGGQGHINIFQTDGWTVFAEVEKQGQVLFFVDKVQGIGVVRTNVHILKRNSSKYDYVADFKLTKAVCDKILSVYEELENNNLL